MAAPHAMESRHVGAIDGPGTTKKTALCHRGPARDGLAILRAQPSSSAWTQRLGGAALGQGVCGLITHALRPAPQQK